MENSFKDWTLNPTTWTSIIPFCQFPSASSDRAHKARPNTIWLWYSQPAFKPFKACMSSRQLISTSPPLCTALGKSRNEMYKYPVIWELLNILHWLSMEWFAAAQFCTNQIFVPWILTIAINQGFKILQFEVHIAKFLGTHFEIWQPWHAFSGNPEKWNSDFRGFDHK